MTKACKTCAAFSRMAPGSVNGMCRARSPVPVLLGMQQLPPVSGLVRGMNGHQAAQPIVQAFFPPVHEDCWCMEWSEAEPERAELTIEHEGAAA